MARERQRILVMRHPQTTANVGHLLSGTEDVDLTGEGERQMFRAIDALVAWAPDRIWTSPLSRCRAIGEEAAARLGVPCEVHDNLHEIEFGSVQGLTVAEVRDQLVSRGAALLDELRPLEGRTACVTHGGFTRALLGAVFGTPLSTFWNVCLPNVSSQVLTCDGDAFSLAALALAPEEVVRRAKSPELIGTDTTKDIAGSDE